MNLVVRIVIAVAIIGVLLGAGVFTIGAATQDVAWLSQDAIDSASDADPAITAPADGGEVLDAAPTAPSATGNPAQDRLLVEVRDACTSLFVIAMAAALVLTVAWIIFAERTEGTVAGPSDLTKSRSSWLIMLLVLVLAAAASAGYYYVDGRLPYLLGTNEFLLKAFAFGAVAVVGFWLATLIGAPSTTRASVPGGRFF